MPELAEYRYQYALDCSKNTSVTDKALISLIHDLYLCASVVEFDIPTIVHKPNIRITIATSEHGYISIIDSNQEFHVDVYLKVKYNTHCIEDTIRDLIRPDSLRMTFLTRHG